MEVMALKNTTNRPLELVFGEQSERIPKGKLGKFHTESEWKGSFAEKQANEFVNRHEAKAVVKKMSDVTVDEMYDPSLWKQTNQPQVRADQKADESVKKNK